MADPGILFTQADFILAYLMFPFFDLFTCDICFRSGKEILVHLVFLLSIDSLCVKFLNDIQSPDPYFHILERPLQILIGPHILPQDIDIDLFFIQHIRIDKVLDVIDRTECHRFRNQTEKFLLNSSEPVPHHHLRILVRRTPGLNLLCIRSAKLRDRSRRLPCEKHLLIKTHTVHQITCPFFLSFGRGINDRSHDKVTFFTLLIKLKRHMRADLACPLVRPILTSCLTTYVPCQLSLAILMSCFVKIIGGAGHHELDRVQ